MTVRSEATVRRLAAALKTAPQTAVFYLNGTVKTVTAAGSVDGVAQVEVTVNGSDTIAPYLASYLTPTVGHLVRVQFVDGSPLIIGRIIGLPTF